MVRPERLGSPGPHDFGLRSDGYTIACAAVCPDQGRTRLQPIRHRLLCRYGSSHAKPPISRLRSDLPIFRQVMAVRGDSQYCGYVSGGCVEAAVTFEAMAAIGTGNDRYLLLGEGSRFFDIVPPCGGGITLTIHCLRDSASLHEMLKKLDERGRAVLRYDPATQRLEAVGWVETIGWRENLFYSAYHPKPRLLLSGGSIERDRTAQLARMAGFELLLREDAQERDEIALRIDCDSAVVLLHHNLDDELPVLTAALDANPFYIGALGSSKTHERRKAALKELGYANGQVARIKAPIGLFGKARDANSLALSVLADVAAARIMPQMAVT